MTPDTAAGCNCHLGSAAICPVHTQADYDAQKASRVDTVLTAEIRSWVNVYERELITRDEMVLEIGKVLSRA